MERLGFVSEPDASEALVFARHFLRLWGILAIVCFLLAGALTLIVTHVRPPNLLPYNFGVNGHFSGHQVTASFEYFNYEGDDGALHHDWTVKYPAHTTEIIVPAALQCSTRYKPYPTIIERWSKLDTNGWSAPDPQFGGRLYCAGPALQRRHSYAHFVLPIVHSTYDFLGSPDAEVDVRVHIEDVENLQIYGGHSLSPSETQLNYYTEPFAEIRYTDPRLEGQREILFVVIGALIALGAAMALECFRPFVEFSARRRSRQGQ